jgi:iron-sulfur cluster assembly protein
MGLLKIKRKGERNAAPTDDVGLSILALGPELLGISDQAALRIEVLLKEQNQVGFYLRVAIKGGGCSGLTIHYEFCEKTRPNDVVFSKDLVKICIDPKSLSILGGATLHFREHLGVGEFLLLNNPAAKQCSCGQSFSF